MLIHSLIAVRWDEQECLFYPIGSEHALKPFTVNGTLTFQRRYYTNSNQNIRLILSKASMEGELPTGIDLFGDSKVITLTHNLSEYLASQLTRYCEQDLPFDRAKESL